MKRKLPYFSEKLKNRVNNKTDYSYTEFEKFLLDKIRNGQFDNHNCKKGRKRNYHQFFEKHKLN